MNIIKGHWKCLCRVCSIKFTENFSLHKASYKNSFTYKNLGQTLSALSSKRHYSAISSKALSYVAEKPFQTLGLEAKVDRDSQVYKENAKHFANYVETLEKAEAIARAGGGEKSIERHVKRHGKLMISDRIKHLVDDVDDFMELSLTAGIGMDYGHVPRGSTLTGRQLYIMTHNCFRIPYKVVRK